MWGQGPYSHLHTGQLVLQATQPAIGMSSQTPVVILVSVSTLSVQVAVSSAGWVQKALFSVLSGHRIQPLLQPSEGAIQVSQPGKARAPVLEAAVVLVLIAQTGQDGAQCPCHGSIPFIVIDESRVIGRDAEVTICSLQALQRRPRSSGPLHTQPSWSTRRGKPKVWHQEGTEEV